MQMIGYGEKISPKLKYVVLKNDDIDKLSEEDKDKFEEICSKIRNIRRSENKKDNIYLVVNIEETYAFEFFRTMFGVGHTPCNDCIMNRIKEAIYEPYECITNCAWFNLKQSLIPRGFHMRQHESGDKNEK